MGARFARLEACDWSGIQSELDDRGYALTPPLLTAVECDELVRLYRLDTSFRSRVIMSRHNFGRGEYKYFADPLPPVVSALREQFYAPLAEVANRWAVRLNQSQRFPASLDDFLATCHKNGQVMPTPLMLRYETNDYNCLHQDLYGDIAFPLQAACVLSRHGDDYTGGEFLLTEQRPRMQTRCEAVTVEQGQFIVFPNRWRPMEGTRGYYRVNVRHGVSRLKSGERFCVGLIFHNAK